MTDIRRLAEEVVYQAGWSPGNQLEFNSDSDVHHLVQAATDMNQWFMTISFDKELEAKAKALNKTHNLKVADPVGSIVYATTKHELGHWDICARSANMFVVIMDAVSDGLRVQGLTKEEIERAAPHVENMFSDTIVNCSQALDPKFLDGLGLLHATRGMHSSALKVIEDDGDYDSLYGVFADVQMKFAGVTKAQRTLVEKSLKDYGRLSMITKAVLTELIGPELAGKAIAGMLTKDEKDIAIEKMRDESRWEAASMNYARIMAPLVKECIDSFDDDELHGWSRQFKSNESFRREVIRKSMEKRGGTPGYASEFEAKDEYFNKAAGDIVINFAKPTSGPAPEIPIFYTGSERLELKDASKDMAHIDWSQTWMPGHGKMPSFVRTTMPVTIMKESKNRKAVSNQDILFVVDVSGSMGAGAIGDHSSYTALETTVYSVLKYLETLDKVEFMRFGLMQYAAGTEFSGWIGFDKLSELRQGVTMDLKRWEAANLRGDTRLDTEAFREAIGASRHDKGVLVISVTDGGLGNSNDVLKAFKDVLEQGHDVVHFEIHGGHDEFCAELEEAGGIPVPVPDASSITGITLDIVKKRYDKRTQEEPQKTGNEGSESLLRGKSQRSRSRGVV